LLISGHLLVSAGGTRPPLLSTVREATQKQLKSRSSDAVVSWNLEEGQNGRASYGVPNPRTA
jgi:hypothetical protein